MLGIVVSFALGYAWGKVVVRTGSWRAAANDVLTLARQVISGIVARFTHVPPSN